MKQQKKSRTAENSESFIKVLYLFFSLWHAILKKKKKNQNDLTKKYLLYVFLTFGKL